MIPVVKMEVAMTLEPLTTEFVACDLCGSEDQTLLYSRIDPVTGGEFHLVECRCGMAFVNPMPTDASIPLLYPADYLKDKRSGDLVCTGMLELLRRLPVTSGRRLLDIGCGRGDFIHRAAEEGWVAEGVDLLDWQSPYRERIHVGDLLEMDLAEHSYDVITAWAMLEHVRRPSLFFGKISSFLADEGRFIFVVPNFGAPGMRHSCTEDVPRHLWLFTPVAATHYLNRFGLEPEAILHEDRIYTAYPFGLLRYAIQHLAARPTQCTAFQNRSVALLRNRQIRGNVKEWLGEVIRSVSPSDLVLDALDLALGVVVANLSRLLGNYGVITVIGRRQRAKIMAHRA